MSTNKSKDRIYLRQDETDLLQSLLQEWYDKGDKTACDAFVTATILPQIQNLNQKDYGPDVISLNKSAKVGWEARISVSVLMRFFTSAENQTHVVFQAVHNWLKNHRPFKERQVFKLERKIPLRRVVGKLKAKEIEAIIFEKYPDLHKSDKTYPGIFQQAVTEVMTQMDDAEAKRMQDELSDWQADGPPLDLRIK